MPDTCCSNMSKCNEMQVQTDSHIVNVNVTSNCNLHMRMEQKFDKGLTIQTLKDKLELITGARSQVMTIEVFDTNDKKTSVWIEDPTEAHGITILASFKKEARKMLKEKMKNTIEEKNMNEQYVLRDVLISYNQTKQMRTK